ncbi:MAG: nitrous oxide reductase accessory protein NosL [Sulfurimonas sp.]|jgi:copper chaperone NosL|nr:nitrous oxide reductase accessory protein NosL [Sulfurimonas sp.]
MIKIVLAIVLATSVLFSYEMDYTKETKGLVRHLKVYKDPRWVSKIELKNGKKIFFSSPKSMIEFYHRPGKWFDIGVKSEDDFKEILVTDFTTLKPINAKGAFFVYGGDITSPAGDDLPPFATYEAAENYSKKYNGKRIMHFNEISDALIRLLNGRI